MDIAAATGKPLSTVTEAIAKAYGGNTAALAKLDPKLKGLIKGGLDAEGAMSVLADTFGGAATTKANTAQGQFQRLQLQLSETKETIGAALLPIIEKILPVLTSFGNWASENTAVFLTIGGAIAGIAAAVLLVNAAMSAWTAITTAFTVVQTAFNAVMAMNPVVLVVIGIVALIAALVLAYKKFEGFRNIVDSVFAFIKTAVTGSIDLIKGYFSTLLGFYKGIFNGIASLWNNTIGKLSFKVPGWVPGLGGKGFDVPNIPMLAEGGIVTKPTLAMIGEGGQPEAVIPLSKLGNMGGNMYVTIQGGDPNAIVDALRRYQRQNGAIPIRTVA
jgi:phage-related protein